MVDVVGMRAVRLPLVPLSMSSVTPVLIVNELDSNWPFKPVMSSVGPITVCVGVALVSPPIKVIAPEKGEKAFTAR